MTTMRNRIVQYYALVFILLGLIIVFASLFVENETAKLQSKPVLGETINNQSKLSSTPIREEYNWCQSPSYHTLLELSKSIGIAIICFGVFGILVDTKNWRDYFAERLKEIVIEQRYLDSMDLEALSDLQTKVMKAFFRDQSIDKEGSFLNYFKTNLL